jgi:hypothetical protein|eukprot:COSAG01_NODE_5993_length_3911_cov_1.807450_5_plen_51_part_00
MRVHWVAVPKAMRARRINRAARIFGANATQEIARLYPVGNGTGEHRDYFR